MNAAPCSHRFPGVELGGSRPGASASCASSAISTIRVDVCSHRRIEDMGRRGLHHVHLPLPRSQEQPCRNPVSQAEFCCMHSARFQPPHSSPWLNRNRPPTGKDGDSHVIRRNRMPAGPVMRRSCPWPMMRMAGIGTTLRIERFVYRLASTAPRPRLRSISAMHMVRPDQNAHPRSISGGQMPVTEMPGQPQKVMIITASRRRPAGQRFGRPP